jgi:CO/xanthine dehydrogenase Mo-binding subunit
MLFGKLLLSPLPHAEILRMDTSLAEEVKRVHKILTSKDVPGPNRYGGNRPVFADHKVRFIGDVIAAVFAETREAAEEAVQKIRVNFKPLPVVSTPTEALRPDGPKVHEEGNKKAQQMIKKVFDQRMKSGGAFQSFLNQVFH